MQNQTNNHESKIITIYSPKKVAHILEVKESFVKRLLRAGELKGFKMGKFWRIPKSALDAYCAACSANGGGKGRISPDTRKKIKFHAALRSQDSIPDTIDRIEKNITDTKDRLQAEVGYRKVASIARLNTSVMLREDKKRKLDTMEDHLGNLASDAYSDINGLVNEQNPDVLEELFESMAKEPQKKRMIDYINKSALEEIGEDKADPTQDEEVQMVKVADV